MPVAIGAPAPPGFDDPIGLLGDCHRRIKSFLGALAFVARRAGGDLTSEERAALDAALRYFRHSAPRHARDEEDSLFPRLRSSPDARDALRLLHRLEREHAVADILSARIDALARQWLLSGRLAACEASLLEDLVARLRDLYTAHIDAEDRQVLPVAGRALSPSQLQAIGVEMAARRGLRVRPG